MVWKRLFGKHTNTDSPPAPAATPEPDDSGIMRRRPPAADPAMQSRLDTLRQRRDMAAYDLERALAARQPENPWRERMELLDRSLATIEDDLRALDATPAPAPFHFPRRRSRTSRSGWKSRSASPSRLDRNDFAGKRRSTGISAADPSFAGRSCSGPEMPPRLCRPRSRRSGAESWSDISPRAHRSSRSTYATAHSTASRCRSGRRWPIWPVPARCVEIGSIGAATATPARRAPTAARRSR